MVTSGMKLRNVGLPNYSVAPTFSGQKYMENTPKEGIFGGGYLLAEKAAAEKAAAEKAAETVWELSDREIEIIKNLG